MKVGNINPILFKSSQTGIKPTQSSENNGSITKLSTVTPDFAVTIPQKYTKFGEYTTENGLKIHCYKLANGHRVTIIPMEDSPAVVKNYVNVGSMNETDDIKGISHFLEHMAFNGTDGNDGYIKLNHGDSFKKIENLGGWTNASTNYALTDYVNSTPQLGDKDLEQQLQIIAAMSEDLTLADNMIQKEKGPVSSEINMILDNPETIVMDQTVRTIFNIKSTADELVGGSVNHIRNLDREKVRKYYETYYTPDNMNLVITGNVDPQKTIETVSRLFKSKKTAAHKRFETKLKPIDKTIRKDFITDKATSTEIMLGFAGPKASDIKNKIITSIVSNLLYSSEAGLEKEFKRLNTGAYFNNEKISTNPNEPLLLYYTLSCADEKSEEALKIMFDKISNLKAPDKEKLQIIKEGMIQDFNDNLEYSLNVNDLAGRNNFYGNLDYLTNYQKIVNSITPEDVQNYINKYLNLNKAAVTLVHPRVSETEIRKNHQKASQLSFKGKPLNMDKVSNQTLSNNYETAFHETKNNNIYFDLNLYFEKPQNINPAAKLVLNDIYSCGTMKTPEDDFRNFEEKNNISVNAETGSDYLNISGYSSADNFKLTSQKAGELLNYPRITEEEFNEAVKRLKDSFARIKDTAVGLYIDNEAKTNPIYTSKEDYIKGLETVTIDDVKQLHNYIMNNSYGLITMNIPEKTPALKATVIEEFSKLNKIKPYKNKTTNIYKPNTKAIVLTKDRAVSQADIMQTYKFPYTQTPKEDAIIKIINTLLSSSHSIGLFNTLREKEHLAYSVYSSVDMFEDCGELSCHILTTTEDNDIGEKNYDNVQKSINGFHRQIGELLDSKYTDEDLESAKRILKANLVNKEGVPAKLSALDNGYKTKEGLEYENILFDTIDSITREDIDSFARKIFKNPPVYSIVASQDTLNANKEYFTGLEV